jgi:hypothetical protein
MDKDSNKHISPDVGMIHVPVMFAFLSVPLWWRLWLP